MVVPEPPPDLASEPAATPRPAADRRAGVAVLFVVLGLLLCLAYRFTIGGEPHSFASGATPPTDFALTAGKTYSIGIPDGVAKVVRTLPDPSAISCDIVPDGGARRQLAVTPESTSSRALNQIATFVAPVSGRAQISCAGLPAVFVDDADDVGTDLAGLWLILASISLAIGLPLLFSVLRRHFAAPAPAPEPEP